MLDLVLPPPTLHDLPLAAPLPPESRQTKHNVERKRAHNKQQSATLSINCGQVRPKLDVNETANTGNTLLHAVANNGNVEVASVLLSERDVNVNARNPQCDDATPLHLAVLHGETLS